MRTWCVLVIAMVAVGCRRAAPSGRALQLARVPAHVGQTWTVEDRLESHNTVTQAPGQVVELATTRVRTGRYEVLAVGADGIVTQIKVRYDQHHDVQTRDGATQTKPHPLEGRTYVARADGDRLAATHDDGSPVDAAEQVALTADVGRAVGKVPAMSRLLLAHGWRVGDIVTLTDAELADAFNQNPMMKPVRGTMLLVGVVAGVATFELDLVLAREDDGGRAESPTRMTVKVDVARFRPIETTLTATLTGTVSGMTTTGTLAGRVTYQYP